ncbi:glycosyltransferase family 2 protein [Aliamphritea ceti]|uniref:glycosyltransferase family 2 protein n=1 Tax=Aliamphritea ceti TaxID=1524258 RepID=UPI0021C2E768|nr:glycosyltransferase family 2 protein [Aliamphritea ceti]
MKLSVCILTFNSDQTLGQLLAQVMKLEQEVIVVDSGSSDKTLEILAGYEDRIHVSCRPYKCHSDQMNHATSLASNDWVLCLDSDELPSDSFIKAVQNIIEDPGQYPRGRVGRIRRNWFVLGKKVHAMYPCSSPDFVVRLYDRTICRFNDSVVDDKVIGFDEDFVIEGWVDHHTFETEAAMARKLDAYVRRVKANGNERRSWLKAAGSATAAFWKWYFVKKAFLDGGVGLKTAKYAARYSFLKYRA